MTQHVLHHTVTRHSRELLNAAVAKSISFVMVNRFVPPFAIVLHARKEQEVSLVFKLAFIAHR